MKSIALTLALLSVFAVAANAADKPVVDANAVVPAAAEEVTPATDDAKPADEAKN